MSLTAEAAPAQQVDVDGESDLLRVRSALRTEAEAAGLGLTGTTKLVTAGSELTRNILQHTTHRQGTVVIEAVAEQGRRGVRATFSDRGPGMPDVEQAMVDGFSTAKSLGLGLPGSRRLVDEFHLDSAPGEGTTIVIAQWSR